MNRRGLGIRAAILVTLALAGATFLGRSRPDSETPLRSSRIPQPRPRDADSQSGAASRTTPAKEAGQSSPKTDQALTHYRVTATDTPEGSTFQGADYGAAVSATGLTMESKGIRVSLRPSSLAIGGRTQPLGPGVPSRTAPNKAEVARTGVIEQYVFENERVEQLFRIDQATRESVSVRMNAEHNLPQGGFSERKAEGMSWRDTTLQKDAVVLLDEAGRPKAAYHSAKVIDAAGRELEISPRLDGNEIVLAVPAAFMAAASYPVVIDPWLEFNFSASGGGVTGTQKVSESVAMALDGSGNPYIVWSDNSSGNYEIYLRYFNGFEWKDLGGSGTGTGISGTPGASSHPCIAFRGGGGQSTYPNNADVTYGFIAVAWDDNSNFGDYEIYSKVWNGAAWVSLAGSATGGGISNNLGQDTFPTIGYVNAYERFPTLFNDDIHSVPIIAWQQDRLGAGEIVAAFLWPADEVQTLESWQRVGAGNGNVSNTPSRVSERPKMVIDRFGRPFVAWADTNNNNYEVYVRGLFGPDNGAGAADLRNNEFYLGLGFNGTVLTYRNSGVTATINWAEVQLSGSGGGVSITADHSLYPSFAIDPGDGSLFVAWEELTVTGSNVFMKRSTTSGVLAPGIPQPANYSVWRGMIASPAPDNVSGTNTARFPSIGIQPAGTGAAVPYIAWQDETAFMPAPQNPEIFVAQFRAGAWGNVGDAGSLTGSRGISATDNFSYFPILQTDALGQPVVAWIDGAFGSYDVYLRKFFVNEAVLNTTDPGALLLPGGLTSQLGQYLLSSAVTPIAVGSSTTEPGVRLRAVLKAESLANPAVTFTRLQVEIRPLNNPFIGTQILESNPIVPVFPATTNGVVAEIIFFGLPNVQWAWRGRAVDSIGRASPWVSFASNGDSGIDFEIRQPVILPPPATLQQYRLDGTTIIGLAATSPENSVVLSGSIVPPNASTTVRLEVEVQPVGTALTGVATSTGAAVSAATTVSLPIPPLADGSYHWAARSVASDGTQTAWVEFGGNTSTTGIDFSLSFPTPSLLAQFRLDGTTPLSVGAISEESGFTARGIVTAPAGGLLVHLDVEVKRTDQAFDGTTNIFSSSPNVASGSTVSVQVTGLPFANYHWRARSTSSINTSSAWTSFGGNADGQTDFQLFVQPPPVDVDDHKKKCGLLGMEVLLVMGVLALRRRRNRA